MGRPQTTKDFPRINLRIPQELYDALNDAAVQNFRSLNNEVMLRLMESLKRAPGAKELEKT